MLAFFFALFFHYLLFGLSSLISSLLSVLLHGFFRSVPVELRERERVEIEDEGFVVSLRFGGEPLKEREKPLKKPKAQETFFPSRPQSEAGAFGSRKKKGKPKINK